MLSYFFYITYFLLCFSSLYFVNKNKIYLLYPLLFTSQFNVTSFLKIGITISFFELNLILVTFGILVFDYIKNVKLLNEIYFRKQDKLWLLFILCSFLTILISVIRVSLGNLKPDLDIQPAYFIRSVMSLNRFFFYFPCFFIIRSHLIRFYDSETIKKYFFRAMGLSGLLPSLAIIIQFLKIGFILIHNNPSFSENYRVENYLGQRPVGLTNEASFFVYQLFFSTMALYYGWKKKFFSNKLYYLLLIIYVFGVIVSISRTGLLIFILFYAITWMRENKIFTLAGFFRILKFLPIAVCFLILAASLNIGGFNIGARVLSTFQQEADLSTLERYGSAQALIKLFLDKSLFLGVGIYNYQYYVKAYLPDFMSIFYYPRGVAPSSFNFVFQIFAEFGLILSILFFGKTYSYIFNNENERFYKDWFLFLFIFSFSFQTLNFAVPFLIFFFPAKKLNENSICIR